MTDAADVASFLGAHRPFAGLDRAQLEAIAAAARGAAVRRGRDDPGRGRPARERALRDRGRLGRAGPRGGGDRHPRAGRGLRPSVAADRHARRRSRSARTSRPRCYVLGRDAAMAALGRPAGVDFVAQTMRERLTRTGHVVHGLPELGTVRVPELISRPPLFCEHGDVDPRGRRRDDRPRRVGDPRARAASALRIVTDADLREHVVGRRGPARERRVARSPARRCASTRDRLAVDAVVDMLEAGVDHLVVEDRRGVRARDRLGDRPDGLRDLEPVRAAPRRAARARRGRAGRASPAGCGACSSALLAAGLPPLDIGRVLTLQLDSLRTAADRLRARRATGRRRSSGRGSCSAAPRGASSRSAPTRRTRSPTPTPTATRPSTPTSSASRSDVNAGLERCGFVARPQRRARAQRAVADERVGAGCTVFRDCLTEPDNSHLIRATVSFDFRAGKGGLEIVAPLIAVIREAPAHPAFLRQLARTSDGPQAAAALHRLVRARRPTARSTSSAAASRRSSTSRASTRSAAGITISPTVDRLVAAAESGALDADDRRPGCARRSTSSRGSACSTTRRRSRPARPSARSTTWSTPSSCRRSRGASCARPSASSRTPSGGSAATCRRGLAAQPAVGPARGTPAASRAAARGRAPATRGSRRRRGCAAGRPPSRSRRSRARSACCADPRGGLARPDDLAVGLEARACAAP